MQILNFTIENIGRFHSLESGDLSAPVIGVLGPNGTGKSTVLGALRYAFTGAFTDREGEREAQNTFVRQFDQERGATNGSIRVAFRKNGMDGEVYRRFGKSPKRYLKWGDQTVTSASAVDKLMAEILGADKSALSKAIFIEQGELSGLLFGSASSREQLFSKLLLIDYIPKISDAIEKKISAISANLQDCTILMDEVGAQRKQAELELAELETELSKHHDSTASLEALKLYNNTAEQANSALARAQQFKQEAGVVVSQIHDYLSRTAFPDKTTAKTVEEFDVLLQQVVERGQSLDRELSTLIAGKKQQELWSSLLQSQAQTRSSLTDANMRLSGLMAVPAEMIRTTEDSLTASRTRDKLVDDIALATREYQLAEANLKEVEASPLVEDAELSLLYGRKQEAQRSVNQLELRIKTIETAIQAATSGAGNSCSCPVCSSPLDLAGIGQEVLPTLRSNLASLNAELLAVSSEHTAKQQQQQVRAIRLQNYQAELQKRSGALTVLHGKLQGLPASDTAGIEAILKNLREAQSQYARAASEVQSLEQRLATLDGQISNFNQADASINYADIPRKEAELKELRSTWSALSQVQKQLLELNKQLASSNGKAAAEETQCNAKRAALAAQSAAFPKELVDTLAWEAAGHGNCLEALTQRQQSYTELRGRVQQAQSQAATLAKRFHELNDRAATERRQRALVDDLRQLKAAFVKSGVPAAYMRYKFEQLCELTRRNLPKLDASFDIGVDPENPLSFVFTRLDIGDGYVMPQNKLSGGQRVRLCVAFLLAVQQLIVPEVGFLVLDEPSTHLDPEGITSLGELFNNLRQQLGNSEAQLLVCDHSELLAPSFGRVLDIKPPGSPDQSV